MKSNIARSVYVFVWIVLYEGYTLIQVDSYLIICCRQILSHFPGFIFLLLPIHPSSQRRKHIMTTLALRKLRRHVSSHKTKWWNATLEQVCNKNTYLLIALFMILKQQERVLVIIMQYPWPLCQQIFDVSSR